MIFDLPTANWKDLIIIKDLLTFKEKRQRVNNHNKLIKMISSCLTSIGTFDLFLWEAKRKKDCWEAEENYLKDFKWDSCINIKRSQNETFRNLNRIQIVLKTISHIEFKF